jgi:3-oxoacyl-[acyl-carrier protein] reductase
LALAREGVELFISARGEERLRATASEIEGSTGARVTAIVADHSTPEGRRALLAACPEPDIVVITSSPPRVTEDFMDIASDEWTTALATGFLGPMELMQAVVGGMKARRFGRIVNIATIGAKTGFDKRVLSASPKAALCNYAASIARPLAPFNVAINTILPGMFETEGVQGMLQKAAEAKGTSYEAEHTKWSTGPDNPAGRFGDPQDVGALCALLCSQYAGFIVGQSIVVDGGRVRSVF